MAELTVTDGVLRNLANRLRNLADSKASESTCFRLRINQRGDPELTLDAPLPEDKRYQYHEQIVLVMSTELAESHGTRIFDVNEVGDFILI